MSNATIPETGYVIESLTSGEMKKLKSMVLGYGRFKKTAKTIDIPETTLRSVINKGYGYPETISKIRTALQSA